MRGKRAIALMSGGLDSALAVRVVHDMGIELIGIHFTGPFCLCNRGSGGCVHYARQQAEALGMPFSTKGLGEPYLEIVVHPKHGYGSGINPCMDCRILMLRRVKAMMAEEGADFVVTGEVVGQRPMSQLKKKLTLIERESGLEGLILRPLSAGVLPETVPEKNGWVDREALLNIEGRSRKRQMELAEAMSIGDYPCPGGGCLLTDKHFAAKMRDHIKHGALCMTDIALLKVGRHFRLPGGAKLVVGRDEAENERLETLVKPGDRLFFPAKVMGPSALLRAEPMPDDDVALAGSIMAAYCRGTGDVEVECRQDDQCEIRTYPRLEKTDHEPYRV